MLSISYKYCKNTFLFFLLTCNIISAQDKSECISGDCYNGTGTYIWYDKKGKPYEKYIGNWKDGAFNGYGSYYYSSGSVYEGNWEQNVKQGQGTMTYNNGQKYIGNWVNGKFDGKGLFFYATGNRYNGEWKKGVENGHGTFYWMEGDKWIGEWKDGKRNGKGIYTSADGKEQTGIWEDDKFVKNIDGLEIGCIEGDCDNGYGIYVWGSGEKYEGNWKNMLRNGKGKNYYANGDEYTGEWLNDMKNGVGTYISKDGKTYSGKWESNELVLPDDILNFNVSPLKGSIDTELDFDIIHVKTSTSPLYLVFNWNKNMDFLARIKNSDNIQIGEVNLTMGNVIKLSGTGNFEIEVTASTGTGFWECKVYNQNNYNLFEF